MPPCGALAQLQRLMAAVVAVGQAQIGDHEFGDAPRTGLGQGELDGIADSLNARPRATHNWHTPLEVFAQTLASSHKPSTSVH